jgi:hypothetical protein
VELFKTALLAGSSRLLRGLPEAHCVTLTEDSAASTDYHELPSGWKNNQCIRSGYRFIPVQRWGSLLGSLFTWHNETINIHTHLIGFGFIVYLIWREHPQTPQAADFHDNIVSLSFLICAAACLLLSSAWHLASGCATCASLSSLPS